MLTIADRRRITARAARDPAFHARLRRAPVDAAAEALGRPLPPGLALDVVEEAPGRPVFVLLDPAAIDAALPEPTDVRSNIENTVYAALRADPALATAALADPAGVLATRFGLDVPAIAVRREAPGRAILVVPDPFAADELDDAALDLVSGGGGNPGCTDGSVGLARTPDKGA